MRAETKSSDAFSGCFELMSSTICWLLHARLLPPWLIRPGSLRIWEWEPKDAMTFFMLASILMACGFGFSISALRHVRSYLRGPAIALLLLNSISIVMLLIYLFGRLLT